MSDKSNVNKALLIAVIVLAAALVGVLVYFLFPFHIHTQTQSKSQTSNPASASAQAPTPTLSFERGVENWLGIECVYNNYGANTTLSLVNDIYTIAYGYLYDYSQTNNVTYLLMYPVAQYQYIASKYPACAINESDQNLVSVVIGALNNITGIANNLNIPGNLLGTPLFIVFDRSNNVTYVLAGASPFVFNAINYAKNGTTTTITYQGQELGYGFKANSTQVKTISEIISNSLRFGNPSANITVIEYLDPECPYCALFQVMYGRELEQLVNSGSIFYAINYFPTHVLGYGCSSPTIAPMLGPYCG